MIFNVDNFCGTAAIAVGGWYGPWKPNWRVMVGVAGGDGFVVQGKTLVDVACNLPATAWLYLAVGMMSRAEARSDSLYLMLREVSQFIRGSR